MAAVGWALPQKIIELSVAKDWPHAVREWIPDGIEVLEGETSVCLCGHKPIVELCYILNTKNRNRTAVGNHCIQKFEAGSEGHAVFGSVPKIIGAVKRILANDTASANPSLIDLAVRKGVFTHNDSAFYRDIEKKRNLTDKQTKYKLALNQKLKFGIIYQTAKLYRELAANPRSLTGYKLVDLAVSKGILRDKDRVFYLSLWNRSPEHPPTQKQINYKLSLNRQMIDRLRAHFEPQQPAAKRARTEPPDTP